MNDTFDSSCKKIKEAVCIDTAKVYDSCADRDCLADMRVYFTDCAQEVIDNAVTVRCRGCEVIDVITDVEKVPFNKGFYSVDLTFFISVTVDAVINHNCPTETVTGLAIYSKKCILYGSEGNVKIFTSEYSENKADENSSVVTSNPRAKIQVADPLCLDTKLCRPCDCCCNHTDICCKMPNCVRRYFNGQFNNNSDKAVRVTIGLFTIVQLERDVQILIPAYDFCIPCKECTNKCDTEDPCDAFRKIKFPVGEFFPPSEKDCENETSYGNASLNFTCSCNK